MSFRWMLETAEMSDDFFNSPEIEESDPCDEQQVREAAELFIGRNKIVSMGGKYTVEWFVKDFFRRL